MASKTKPRGATAQTSGVKRRASSPEPHLASMGVEIQRFGTTRFLPIAL